MLTGKRRINGPLLLKVGFGNHQGSLGSGTPRNEEAEFNFFVIRCISNKSGFKGVV